MTDNTSVIPAHNRDDEELRELHNSDDVAKLKSLLYDGEKVIRLIKCMNDGSDGVIAATDKRVVFCDKHFISSDVVEFLYSEIAVVLSEAELVTTKLSLISINTALYVDGIDKDHADRFLSYLEEHIGQDYEVSGSKKRHFKHVGENLLSSDEIGSSPTEQS